MRQRKLCNLSELGFDLADERVNRGWSQRYVAKQLGLSYQSYQNWEHGLTKSVTPANFEKLKNLFAPGETA